jgi:hypothetical protein
MPKEIAEMDHFSMEVLTNEKINQLRNEGLASQEFQQAYGKPKKRGFFSKFLVAFRLIKTELSDQESIEKNSLEPNLQDQFRPTN